MLIRDKNKQIEIKIFYLWNIVTFHHTFINKSYHRYLYLYNIHPHKTYISSKSTYIILYYVSNNGIQNAIKVETYERTPRYSTSSWFTSAISFLFYLSFFFFFFLKFRLKLIRFVLCSSPLFKNRPCRSSCASAVTSNRLSFSPPRASLIKPQPFSLCSHCSVEHAQAPQHMYMRLYVLHFTASK